MRRRRNHRRPIKTRSARSGSLIPAFFRCSAIRQSRTRRRRTRGPRPRRRSRLTRRARQIPIRRRSNLTRSRKVSRHIRRRRRSRQQGQNYQPPAQQNYAPRSGQQSYAAPPTKPAYVAPAATAAAAPPPAQQDYSELATLSEAVAYRGVPRLDANTGSRSNPRDNSSRYPGSTPIRAASAEHLHAFRSALLPAAGPAGQHRAATGRDRRRGGASRQSRPHQLAALSEAVAVRGFLEQAIKSCFVAAILDLKT